MLVGPVMPVLHLARLPEPLGNLPVPPSELVLFLPKPRAAVRAVLEATALISVPPKAAPPSSTRPASRRCSRTYWNSPSIDGMFQTRNLVRVVKCRCWSAANQRTARLLKVVFSGRRKLTTPAD